MGFAFFVSSFLCLPHPKGIHKAIRPGGNARDFTLQLSPLTQGSGFGGIRDDEWALGQDFELFSIKSVDLGFTGSSMIAYMPGFVRNLALAA